MWAPASGLPEASNVLAVCAHPDDESFGLGAVLSSYASEGADTSLLCFTHGEASTLGRAAGPLAELRRRELTDAAAALGISRVTLLDYPDGALDQVSLERLADHVAGAADTARADLLLVFDQGGITGHRDHCRATDAALAGLACPVLAWSLPSTVSAALNSEYSTGFVGRDDHEIDVTLAVDRDRQREAISCHISQSRDNRVLWRRLELLGDHESLRWLRPPPPPSPAPGVAHGPAQATGGGHGRK